MIIKSILSPIFFFSLLAFLPSSEPLSTVIESEKLSFQVDTVVDGLKNPWSMAFLPNGDMLFTERGGELFLLEAGQAKPIEIKGVPKVKAKGQGGLFDLELHPQYEENGYLYLSYSSPAAEGEDGEGANTALMRARIEGGELIEQKVIFKALPNYSTNHHFGARIEFDKEGFLYLSVGDRGGRDLVQDLSNPRGKVFRMYDDGSIPDDNPTFAGAENVYPGTFSYGHRNPQGLALHPETGELWEHEHGPQGGDEVNIIRAGHNYGWPVITYGINYDNSIITTDTVQEGMDQPVTFYRPSIAPCGMTFVTSDQYPAWKGNLMVGSLKFQRLQRVELEGNEVIHQEILLEGMGRVRAVRQSPFDGYLYVAFEGPGSIVRLIPQ